MNKNYLFVPWTQVAALLIPLFLTLGLSLAQLESLILIVQCRRVLRYDHRQLCGEAAAKSKA